MDPVYLGILAIKLAILTFYLGVLVYALPLPLRSIKKWAPELLSDGVQALFIALIYGTLYVASLNLAGLLGGSWTLLDVWIKKSVGVIVNIKMFLAALGAVPVISKISGIAYAVAGPLDRAATLALLFMVTLSGIIELVTSYGLALLALGVALYAIPFKLAKSAGAWLIAFILVFNVGLPLLPSFIVSLASEPSAPGEAPSFSVVKVKVASRYGHPASYGFLKILDDKARVVAAYPLDSYGYATSLYHEVSGVLLPSNIDLYPILEYDGYMIPLTPSPLKLNTISSNNIELRAPHVALFREPLIMILVSNPDYELKESGGSLTITTVLGGDSYVDVRAPSTCSLNVTATGANVNAGTWEWRGVSGFSYTVTAGSEGEYEVNVAIHGCSPTSTPNYGDSKDYADELARSFAFLDINLVKAFVLYYLTVPFIYVFTLFLATASLARVLGGRDRIPVKVA
ncbi:MAG: hypothetical protein P3X22_006025 [Thermoprotei archaeon]|nr:hypothetical protein [Thermoprotei archaeon]